MRTSMLPKCKRVSAHIFVLLGCWLVYLFWFLLGYLVGVRKAAHAAHDTENVVVDGVDTHLGRAARAHRVDGHRQLERRLVDAGEVARARRLVLLRLQGKRVHADAHRRRASVVLERLHTVEVASLTLREAVLAVELELGDLRRRLALAANTRGEDDLGEQVVRRVLEHHALLEGRRRQRRNTRVQPRRTTQRRASRDTNTREVRARRSVVRRRRDRAELGSGAARLSSAQAATGEHVHHDALSGEVIRVVERLHAVDLGDERLVGRAVDVRVTLDDPHELLHRVVEVELDLVRRGRDRLGARELQLLDEVLVRLLGEAATLLRVQVDVVDVERRSRQRLDRRRRRRRANQLVVDAVDPLLELHVDAHLVVLERDQRDRQARVTAEPELERDVERLRRRARTGGARVRQLRASARGIQLVALAVLHQHEVVRVADHVVERLDRAHVLRELGPDLHPVAVLAVDALAADLELNRLDQAVADVVEPAEAVQLGGVGDQVHRREDHLDVRAVHQVGVTVDHGRNTLVEVRLAVEGDLNRLHGEVRVALVQHLPERDLRVARDVDVLRTIAHELKKTATHIVCMIVCKKNNLPTMATH